jgi:hypothetical protein
MLRHRSALAPNHSRTAASPKIQFSTLVPVPRRAGVLALKQYYAIATIDARNMHAISESIDPFWHAHILHSEEYTEFCDQIVGRYLHHYQSDHANVQDMDFVCGVYQYTMSRYKECFKTIDARFHVPKPPRNEHPCTHRGDIHASFAMFPVVPEAKPRMTAH